jgi:GINS complex subunit 2
MALPLPPGLTPPEIAFLCEMELVTVIPRQRMDSLPLLSVSPLSITTANLPFEPQTPSQTIQIPLN